MASKKEINDQLKIALKEVGEIKPWFDKEVDAWIFSHSAYPVEYGGKSREEVIKKYPFYLREFIKHRLDGTLSPFMEKKTKGRGGKRKGAGRPKGTKKQPKRRAYLPLDIANWFQKHPSEAISSVRQLIAKSRY